MRIFDRTFLITRVLYWLAAGVAAIGLVSALLAWELQRDRELALLRALGLTPAGGAALVVAQTLFMGAPRSWRRFPPGSPPRSCSPRCHQPARLRLADRSASECRAVHQRTRGSRSSPRSVAGLYPAWRSATRHLPRVCGKNEGSASSALAAALLAAGCRAAAETAELDRRAGFAQVLAPRAFSFPRDHGPHREFRQEWWYTHRQPGSGRWRALRLRADILPLRARAARGPGGCRRGRRRGHALRVAHPADLPGALRDHRCCPRALSQRPETRARRAWPRGRARRAAAGMDRRLVSCRGLGRPRERGGRAPPSMATPSSSS